MVIFWWTWWVCCNLVSISDPTRVDVLVIPVKILIIVIWMSFFTINKMSISCLSVYNSQTIGIISIGVCSYGKTEDFNSLNGPRVVCQIRVLGSEEDDKWDILHWEGNWFGIQIWMQQLQEEQAQQCKHWMVTQLYLIIINFFILKWGPEGERKTLSIVFWSAHHPSSSLLKLFFCPVNRAIANVPQHPRHDINLAFLFLGYFQSLHLITLRHKFPE